MLLLKVVVLCVALTSCLAAPSLSKRGRLMDLSTYWETLQKLRDHSNDKTNGNGNDEQTRSTEKPIFTEEQIREILHILDIKLTKRNLDFLKNPDVIEKMKEYLRNNGGLMISRSIDEDLYGAPLTHSQIMDLIEEHIGKRSSSSWFEEFYGKPLTTQQVYDQIIKPQLGKRSDLYGSPLTHAQIMDLVRQHAGKRSSSSWYENFYGKPLTTQQVYDKIIKPQVGKRYEPLPEELYGKPLTTDQIMDLIKEHMNQRRMDNVVGPPLTHEQTMEQVGKRYEPLPEDLYGKPLTRDQILDLIKEHMSSHGKRSHPPATHEKSILIVHELDYNTILAMLGDYMKGS